MSGFFKFVGTIASIAAVIPGPHQPIAAGVAAISGTVAQLTAKKPRAQGTVTEERVGANQPLPYLIGEAYTEGVRLHKVGYGGEVNDVENPYAFWARTYSCAGPIQSIGSVLVNFESTSFTGSVGTVREAVGYYEEYLYVDEQLGARPEADALAAPAGWGTPTNWSSAHKCSSHAAVAWSFIFSKKGKRWGSGIPPMGHVAQGVKVYDPRLDSTYPGGSGSHRITDESTWEYSTNPALHAATYVYGRKVNGVPVFGGRFFDAEAIDLADVVAWANVCDTNGWTANGTIYEPADKWNNLKRICEAGGGEPVLAGGMVRFDYQAPRTSLYTVTKDDLANGSVSASLGKGWKNRANTLTPRYRSASHQWGYVQADPVSIAAAVTADGEDKIEERQWDLVTDVDQVTELATYDLYQRREAGPISFTAKPHMRIYGPGDCLTLGSDLGVHPDGAVKVVVRSRAIDVEAGTVRFTCELETDAKHTAALGLTGGAPASTTLPTTEDLDDAAFLNLRVPVAQINFSTPAAFAVQADSDGVTTTDLSTITRTLSVLRGDEAQTSGVTVGTPSGLPSSAITATASVASGVVTVELTKADAAGAVSVPVTFGESTYDVLIPVDRTVAAPAVGGTSGSTSFSDTVLTNVSSTTYARVSDDSVIVRSDGSGELNFKLVASYEGSGAIVAKPRYSTDDVTFTDVTGGETTGSTSVTGAEPDPGYIFINVTQTGLTPNTDYYVDLQAKRSGGSGTLSWSGATFTVKQP